MAGSPRSGTERGVVVRAEEARVMSRTTTASANSYITSHILMLPSRRFIRRLVSTYQRLPPSLSLWVLKKEQNR